MPPSESLSQELPERTYLSDRAQFNYAEFLLTDGDYPGAVREFERFIALFPGSPYISKAQFKIAESYIGEGRYAAAVEVLDMFAKNFPDDPLAAEAELMRWTLAGEGSVSSSSTAGVKVIMPALTASASVGPVSAPVGEASDGSVDVTQTVKADIPAEVDVIMSALTASALVGPVSAPAGEALDGMDDTLKTVKADTPQAGATAAGAAAVIIEAAPLPETEKAALSLEFPVPGGSPRQSVKVGEASPWTQPPPVGVLDPMEDPVEDERLAVLSPDAPLPPESVKKTPLLEQMPREETAPGAGLEEIVADIKDTAPMLKEETGGAAAVSPGVAILPPDTQDKMEEGDEGPLRAVQVMYFNGRSMDEIEDEMGVLESSGINTIIVRVFHNDGDTLYPHIKAAGVDGDNAGAGVYFKSAHSPVVSDMLAGITERAHLHGLKVFAWMTTRYADYGIEERYDLACRGYDLSTGDIVRCKGLDVFNDAVVERLSAIYAELASYDIDGILFQDDLVLRHTEGFGVHAAGKYMEETGRILSPKTLYTPRPEGDGVDYTPEFWKWASWKNKTLLGVTEELKRSAREVNPDIKFAINLMYEAVTNPGGGLAWLSQDLKKAREIGFDYYSIMAYHRQMGDELGKNHGEIKEMIAALVADAVDIVGEPNKVLIKLQTIDWKTSRLIPYGEVIGLVRSVRGMEEVSLAVVPYKKGFPFYELTLDNDLVFLK